MYKLTAKQSEFIDISIFQEIELEKIFQAIDQINYINEKQSIQKNLNELALLNQLTVIWFNLWK